MIDLLIDASGSGPLFRAIPGLIRKQATILLYGHGHGGEGLELLNPIQWREPTFVSPCGASGSLDPDGRPATYRRALELLERGSIDARALVTHRLASLEQLPATFTDTCREPGYVKGVCSIG
jgi:L-iditol 2-dehydrogenase